jgi:hypothetical protein
MPTLLFLAYNGHSDLIYQHHQYPEFFRNSLITISPGCYLLCVWGRSPTARSTVSSSSLPFRSEHSLAQSVPGRLKSPIITVFLSAFLTISHSSVKLFCPELGGRYIKIMLSMAYGIHTAYGIRHTCHQKLNPSRDTVRLIGGESTSETLRFIAEI